MKKHDIDCKQDKTRTGSKREDWYVGLNKFKLNWFRKWFTDLQY